MHDLGKRHKIWAKLYCPPKFFWAGTAMYLCVICPLLVNKEIGLQTRVKQNY